MATELYTGTEAVGGTEHSCTTDTSGPDADTTNATVMAFVDVSDMIAGDVLQIRAYEKVRSGDTQRVVEEWVLRDAQSMPIFVTPPLILMHGWDLTLKALAGTITVNWSIRQA